MNNKALQHRSTAPLRKPSAFACVLTLVVLCGAWLRCWQAGDCLWLDELHTSWVVAGALSDIPERAQAGNQSPLYFYFVWSVVQISGQTPEALRLISLGSGILLIAAVAWLVQHWTGSQASGLLAALLVALNRDCIFFAQEARPYALVQLSVACHAAVFVAMLDSPTWKHRLLYVLGAGWLFYLHYTAFLVVVAQAVAVLVLFMLPRVKIQYRPKSAVCDAFLIALMLLPAITHLLEIAQHRENWERIVRGWPPPYAVQVACLLFAGIPLAAVLLGTVMRWQRPAYSLLSPSGIWVVCWFAVPVVIVWLLTASHMAALFLVRYVVASIVGGSFLASLCHGLFTSRWYRGTLAAVLILGAVLTNGVVQQIQHDGRVIGDRNEAWDSATDWLNAQLESAPSPCSCAGLLEDLGLKGPHDQQLADYCLFPLTGIYSVHSPHLEPLPTTPHASLTARQQKLVLRYKRMWLVVRDDIDAAGRIASSLHKDLRAAGLPTEVLNQTQFGTLVVLHLGEL